METVTGLCPWRLFNSQLMRPPPSQGAEQELLSRKGVRPPPQHSERGNGSDTVVKLWFAGCVRDTLCFTVRHNSPPPTHTHPSHPFPPLHQLSDSGVALIPDVLEGKKLLPVRRRHPASRSCDSSSIKLLNSLDQLLTC